MLKRIKGALFGTASQMAKDDVRAHYERLFCDEEEVLAGFKIVRDTIIFTDRRLILEDVQGITGKKREYLSIPYSKISAFAVESAGHFDMDAELKIWVSGLSEPVKKKFDETTDIYQIQSMIAANS